MGEQIEFDTTQFEAEVFEEYRLILRVVDDISGEESLEEIVLPTETLGELIFLT